MPKHELSPLPAAVGGQVGVGHDEHAGQRDGVRKGEEEAGGQDPGHLQQLLQPEHLLCAIQVHIRVSTEVRFDSCSTCLNEN